MEKNVKRRHFPAAKSSLSRNPIVKRLTQDSNTF